MNNENIKNLYAEVLKNANADKAESDRLAKIANKLFKLAEENDDMLMYASAKRYARESEMYANRANSQFNILKLADSKLSL